MHILHRCLAAASCALFAFVVGCSSSSGSTPDAGPPGGSGTAQTPPTGQAAVDAWLAQGFYKSWACEAAVHAGRAPTVHGFNRVCSNDLLSQASLGTGEWPMGAAAVKELYASLTDITPVGYAVYLKQAAASSGGAGWYWYERVPGDGVVADGVGSSGAAKNICVACHVAAGSDADHTPSAHGHDFVYTPVPPQTPPSGQATLEAWLAKGFYTTWTCEAAPHEARSPSPHMTNRICSNNVIAASASGTAAWPAGAASVKEIFGDPPAAAPIGYAVSVKQAADSMSGAGWYWYERITGTGVVADGIGSSGDAKDICVGCHIAAGSDADHTPTVGGRDEVYTPL